MKISRVIILFLVSILPFSFSVLGQEKKSTQKYEVEIMPEFPGGLDAMKDFLSKEINYPVEAQENGIAGKVFISFVVKKDGSINDAKIVRPIDKNLDAEALRVVKSMPKWTPGKDKGKLVDVEYTLPINFALCKKKKG